MTYTVLSLVCGTVLGQFTTVINSPPTIIGDVRSIDSHTQLNIFDGGAVGHHFSAGNAGVLSDNIEVNISGGLVGDDFGAERGSHVAISGGIVGQRFDAENGSSVTISGGSFGRALTPEAAAK